MKPHPPVGYLPRLLSAAAHLSSVAGERRRAILGLSADADIALSVLLTGSPQPAASIAGSAALTAEATEAALEELVRRSYVRETERGLEVTPAGHDAVRAAGLRLEPPASTRLRAELAAIIRSLEAEPDEPPPPEGDVPSADGACCA